MAKNKGLKWIVGLSSVAVFTGFVGLSQKYSYFPDDHSG